MIVFRPQNSTTISLHFGAKLMRNINYTAINSCITFLPTLAGKQLILVEDLISKNNLLHPVQETMVKCHGSQCGFCTPGFIMSLFSMFKNYSKFKEEIIKDSIAGNLCLRCDHTVSRQYPLFQTDPFVQFYANNFRHRQLSCESIDQ